MKHTKTRQMGLFGTMIGLMLLLTFVLCMPATMPAADSNGGSNMFARGDTGVFGELGDAEDMQDQDEDVEADTSDKSVTNGTKGKPEAKTKAAGKKGKAKAAAAKSAEDDGDEFTDDEDEGDSGDEEAAADQDKLVNEIRMSADGTFEFHVQDADLRSVLKHLSSLGRVNIIVTKNVTGTVTLDMYGVTLMEALRIIVRSNGLVYRKEGKFIFIYTEKEYQDSRKMEFRVFRLSFITSSDAMEMIKGALSKDGKITATPKTWQGVVDDPTTVDEHDQGGAMNNATIEVVIVFDYEENLEKVAEILHDIDVRPKQVLIETTILAAQLTERTSLGVNIQALSGTSMGALGATTDLTSMSFTPAAANALGSNNTHGRFNLPFHAQVADGATPMTVGFLYNNTAVFIEALEQVANTTVIANPKMLVVHKQRGDILIGREEGYITTTVSEGFATQTVEFLRTGTNLRVRPFISSDGFVRMEIFPEISDGSVRVIEEGTPPLPEKTTTQIITNVIVKDGHTLVIGGLFRDRIQTQTSQVPILGDIPHLGAAFRSTYDTTVREEIIILITPHIIRHVDDAAFGENLKDDVERCRVGARKSIQWFGRSRIADAYINEAERAYNDGNDSRANWCIDLALAIEPEEDQAIDLKEKLTGTPYWANTPRFSMVSQVVDRMVMNELGFEDNSVVYPTKKLDDVGIPAKARKALGIRRTPQQKADIRRLQARSRVQTVSDTKPQAVGDLEIFTPEPPKKAAPAVKEQAPTPAAPQPTPQPAEPKPLTELKPQPAPAEKAPVKPAEKPEVKPAPAAKVEKPAEKKPATAVKTEKKVEKKPAAEVKTEKPAATVKVEKVEKAPRQPQQGDLVEAGPPSGQQNQPAPSQQPAGGSQYTPENKQQYDSNVDKDVQNIEKSVEDNLEQQEQNEQDYENTENSKADKKTDFEVELLTPEKTPDVKTTTVKLMDPALRAKPAQAEDMLPKAPKVLSTSPLMPEPTSLKDELKQKIGQEAKTAVAEPAKSQPAAAKPQAETTPAADTGTGQNGKWNVWTIWDEEEPVSAR